MHLTLITNLRMKGFFGVDSVIYAADFLCFMILKLKEKETQAIMSQLRHEVRTDFQCQLSFRITSDEF